MTMADISDTIKKEIPELLIRNLKNVALVCKKVNIARSTFYKWRQEDPEFDLACHDAIESLKDTAESTLYHKMLVEKETACLIFFHKTQMKDRGYVERQELTGADGKGVQIDINPLHEQNMKMMKKVTTNGE